MAVFVRDWRRDHIVGRIIRDRRAGVVRQPQVFCRELVEELVQPLWGKSGELAPAAFVIG